MAAVVAADIPDYGRLMAADAQGVWAQLKVLRKDFIDPAIAAHRGRVVKATGDSMLLEFASTLDAARGAIEFQRGIAALNAEIAPNLRIEFRIGLHVGDIIVDEDDIFGESVNTAVRLEGLAEPGGVCISDDAYRQIRGRVDISCDDLGRPPLKNIAEPIRVWRMRLDGSAAPASPASEPAPSAVHALALPDKPSIAVLPFQNMSTDPEQEYFADGLVDDIIIALSRFTSLFVIARNSAFTYKGRSVEVKQIGRELGVRYVLEGSVRKAGARLRITGQLVDCSTGYHLWAERFDGALEQVFELQDHVASGVAGIIDPLLLDTEIKRVANRPTADMTAYSLYLRALPLIRAWAREPNQEAIALLQQAIERDPNYGLAIASLALCHSQNFASGWGHSAAIESERGTTLARRALDTAPGDSVTVLMAVGALLNLGSDANALKGLVDRALAHNPSHAYGWLWSGWVRAAAGESDLAIEHFEKSMRLDPRSTRRAFHLTGIGVCHFFQRRFDKAAAILDESFRELPTYPLTMWFLAACYAQTGRLNEAREFASRNGIRADGPWLTIGSRFGNPAHSEMLLSSLRLATSDQA
nr:adenylate/guanylate cyclase domain-containing protein [Bradyrhizobium sp. dw_411]